MNRRTLILALTAGSAALAAGASLEAFGRRAPATQRLAGAQPIGERSLYALDSLWTTDAGRTLRLAELAGHVQLLAMMFTSCPSVCPMFVREIVRLDRALAAKIRDRLHVTLVSIDPERDTPDVLRRYRGRMGLDRERFALLRGEPGDVRELAQVIGVAYAKTEGADIAHTRLVTVLDRGGEVVHQQAGVFEDQERLMQGIARAGGLGAG
jgi:protein SCO1/2